MSSSEDVKTLYRRFGGQPDSYQEVVREKQAGDSLVKWAMLGQVNLAQGHEVPSVHRNVRTAATRPYSENLAEIAAEQRHAAELAAAEAMAQRRAAEEAAARLSAQLESQRAAAEAAVREAALREQAAQQAAQHLAAQQAAAAQQAEAAARAAQMAIAVQQPAPYAPAPAAMARPTPATFVPAAAHISPEPVRPAQPSYAGSLRRAAAAADSPQPAAGSLQNVFGRIAGGPAKPQGLSALKRKYQK